MKEIIEHVNKEFEIFSVKYYGAPILDDLIEMKVKAETWLLRCQQRIKGYYWSRKKEEKLSLSLCYKSFKLRLNFSNTGQLQINLDHSYSHISNIDDKIIREKYYADPGYVYFIESEFGWKIGKTRDLDKRKNIFEVKLPFKFALRYFVKCHEISTLEIYLHNYFKDKRIDGEWFLITTDDIRNCIEKLPETRLRVYRKDEHLIIDQEYKNKIA